MPSVVNHLIKFRWFYFFLSIAYVAFAAYGFKQFKFDASPRSYFEEGHPPFERFQDLEQTYGRDFRVFMMLSAKQGDLFNPQDLQAIMEVTEKAWLIEHVRRVDSFSNYQLTFSEEDELIVEDFISDKVLKSKSLIQQRKAMAKNDIGLINRLISADGKHAAIIMALSVDDNDKSGHNRIVEAAYQIEDQIKSKYSNIDIALTGNLLSNYHNIQIAIEDVGLMFPLMFGLMFVLIGSLLKSPYPVFVAFIVATLSALAALGTGAWLGIEYSMLAINAFIISITIAVAHCIHIFTQFYIELRDKPKLEALKDSLKVNYFAVSMTTLTTMVGFLSLNFNDLPPAVALGNAAAIGTGLGWLFSLTVLPALVSLLPFKPHKLGSNKLELAMSRLAEFVIHHRLSVMLSMSALTFIMVALSFSNILNDRFSEMIHEPHIFRADTAAIDEHFGALYTTNYDADSGSENGIADPHYLRKLDAFAEFLRAQPEVRSVHSFADVVKRLNQSMHDNDPAFYTIPDDRELTAQYILLYEMSLPFGLDLNDQVTLDKQRSRLMVAMPSIDTRQLMDLEQRVIDWQQESNNLPEHMRHQGASMSIIWAHLSKDSLTSSLTGSVVALSLISLILLIMLRSVRYGLVSLIPNLIPAAYGFGGWFLYQGEVGLGLTCVVIITIGIVVDDTVHFLAKYKKAFEENGHNAEAAIRATFKQVGPALCITTMVLASGFIVLSLSKIVANSALGGVTAMILVAAFVLDVLLLPAVLLTLDKKE